MLAFANFGLALRSSADSAKSSSSAVLDYSRQDLSISSEAREKVKVILLGFDCLGLLYCCCTSLTLDWLMCLDVLTNIDEVFQISAQHLMACFVRL